MYNSAFFKGTAAGFSPGVKVPLWNLSNFEKGDPVTLSSLRGMLKVYMLLRNRYMGILFRVIIFQDAGGTNKRRRVIVCGKNKPDLTRGGTRRQVMLP